jgi:hypothetical protein
MKTNLLLFCFFLGLVGESLAETYPITPRPLRKLVMEAEYIVYADVLDILPTSVEEEDDFWTGAYALLEIQEVVQGKINTQQIKVPFAPNIICPAPARYVKGEKVLAFLDQDGEGYRTHALSYGTKSLNQNDFLIYKARIGEMQDILKLEGGKEKLELTVDWLVRCIEHPATRWEGTYELSPQSDFMSFYDQDKNTFTPRFFLTADQRSRLRSYLFQSEYLGYEDVGLIDLVVQENDRELLDFLITKLKAAKEIEWWHADFLMTRIAQFSERKELQSIIDEMEAIGYMDGHRDKKVLKLTEKFLNQLK